MKKFNYKKVGKEIGWNFSKINYTVEHLSDFDYYKEVNKHISQSTKLLDIGCGSAEKTARFFGLAKKVYFTDNEPEMLKKAKKNVEMCYQNLCDVEKKFNFKLIDCMGTFPFPDNSFDLVVSRHCGANMKEVYRVLKHNGVFVSEDVSFDDCQELKDLFSRGQGYGENPLYNKTMIEILDAGFSKIEFLKFEEIEYYKSIFDLKYLLEHTPILNGFDEKNDTETLLEYEKRFSTKKGIKVIRKLYSFILTK